MVRVKMDKKLSVIVTNDGNIPSKYAHSFNVMKMAQGFYDNNCDVRLISLQSLPNIISRLFLGKIHKYYTINKKIKLIFLPVFNKDYFKKSIGVKSFNKTAAQYIKKRKPDIVFCRSYKTVIECVKRGLATIVETHSTNYDHPDLELIYKIAKNPNFLGLVTIHENIKKEHIKRNIPENKVLVLDDGVNIKQFDISDDKNYWRKKLNLNINKKILLYSGSLYKEKGINSILKIHSTLLSKRKDFLTILVGGKRKDINHWKKICKELNLTNIIFTGFKANYLIPQYLKAADILIMPYEANIDYKVMDINTTSPLKLFEYMASKRPVVTSNIQVITKTVKNKESALLSNPGDINDLVKNIEELFEDKKLAKCISNNAYEIVQNYSWKKRCKKILDYSMKKLKENNLSRNWLELISPEDICIDCGANIGYITRKMAAKCLKTYAFEPNWHAFQELQKRFKKNNKVECLNKAVWDKNTKLKLYMHENSADDEVKWSTGSSLLSYKKNVSKDKYYEVDVIDIIEFIKKIDKTIAIIKIDIEGAECEILDRIIKENIYKSVKLILVETHDHKIKELKEKTDIIRKKIQDLQIDNICLDWI